jgi:ssRNA-specific RNase YbeY (16S rRNA maturation enzyme)
LGFLDAEVSVTFVDDAAIADLAGRFGRVAEPTDVLAFSMLEGDGAEFRGSSLGDVVISVARSMRELEDHLRWEILRLE